MKEEIYKLLDTRYGLENPLKEHIAEAINDMFEKHFAQLFTKEQVGFLQDEAYKLGQKHASL